MTHEFVPVTPSNIVGHSALMTLGNRGAHIQAAPVTEVTHWGQIIVQAFSGDVDYVVDASAAFTGDRTVAVSVQFLDAGFSVVSVALATLDSTTLAAAGRHVFSIADVAIPAGRAYQITTTYTAGTGGGSPMLVHYLNSK